MSGKPTQIVLLDRRQFDRATKEIEGELASRFIILGQDPLAEAVSLLVEAEDVKTATDDVAAALDELEPNWEKHFDSPRAGDWLRGDHLWPRGPSPTS